MKALELLVGLGLLAGQIRASGPYVFRGKFDGKCQQDGLYYRDAQSFVFCANGNSYIQPCAAGTKNSPDTGFHSGKKYYYNNFCDINLLSHGYTPEDTYQKSRFRSRSMDYYGYAKSGSDDYDQGLGFKDSYERGVAYEKGASYKGASYKGASYHSKPTAHYKGSSYDKPASYSKGASYKGASYDKGASYNKGASYDKGASNSKGASNDKGSTYDQLSAIYAHKRYGSYDRNDYQSDGYGNYKGSQYNRLSYRSYDKARSYDDATTAYNHVEPPRNHENSYERDISHKGSFDSKGYGSKSSEKSTKGYDKQKYAYGDSKGSYVEKGQRSHGYEDKKSHTRDLYTPKGYASESKATSHRKGSSYDSGTRYKGSYKPKAESYEATRISHDYRRRNEYHPRVYDSRRSGYEREYPTGKDYEYAKGDQDDAPAHDRDTTTSYRRHERRSYNGPSSRYDPKHEREYKAPRKHEYARLEEYDVSRGYGKSSYHQSQYDRKKEKASKARKAYSSVYPSVYSNRKRYYESSSN